MEWLFETSRIRMRKFTPGDFELMYKLCCDPDVMKYIHEIESREKQIERYGKRILGFYDEHPGMGIFAAFTKENDEFIGFGLLNDIIGTGDFQVGYRLHKKFWNQGYATEITARLLDYFFNDLKMDRITAITNPDNTASQRVLLKSGLKYIKDAWLFEQNVRYFELLKSDYAKDKLS